MLSLKMKQIEKEERSKLSRYKRIYKSVAIKTYLETRSIKEFVKVEIIKVEIANKNI